MDKRLNDIEESVKEIAIFVKQETDRLENLMKESNKDVTIKGLTDLRDQLKDEVSKFKILKSEIETITHGKHDLMERISKISNTAEKCDTLYTRMETLQEKMNVDVQKIDHVKNNIENDIHSLEDRVKTHIEKIESLRESIELKLQSLELKLSTFNDAEQRISKDLNRNPQINKLIADRVDSMLNQEFEKYLSQMKDELDKEAVQRISMEKGLTELTEKIHEVSAKLNRLEKPQELGELAEIRSKLNKLERKPQEVKYAPELKFPELNREHILPELAQSTDLDKTVLDLQRKVEDVQKSMEEMKTMKKNIETRIKDMYDVRKELEKQEVTRNSSDKALQDAMARMNYLENIVKGVKDLELFDADKLKLELDTSRKKVENIEKNIEHKTQNIVVKQLDEFAKAMDHKVPALVTKQEFNEFVKNMELKIKHTEAPDFSGLERKMDMLEKQLYTLTDIIKRMFNRAPVVVE